MIALRSVAPLLAVAWLSPAGGQDPSANSAQAPSTVQELLARLDRAAAGLQDYTVTGKTEAGGKTQSFRMAYKRPNLVRIDTHSGQVSVQPDGKIKGRLGSGSVGHIAQELSRCDKRLLDAEGIPFFESDFVSMLARVEAKIRGGAVADLQTSANSCMLVIRSGDMTWRYRFGKGDLSLLESSRWVSSRLIEITHYADFHANTGLKADHFRF